ncbi:hypothetical protein [Sphingomonas morindae]|uniref:Integrase n=1 Tax=Sphingomonas morindae TaxID=1541170 RepID=A0ABY4X6Y1_9SPHN|nr:hypothetical protein [Sphingomonas morindae]USI72689.1 hypothetical protein LHA26_15640 [Sphingomonas morindae]
MPATKRPKPLYQRGAYKLYARAGRALEIIWYDPERRRERSLSAGTRDLGEARLALDRLFLASTGAKRCPTCHRAWDHRETPLLADAIADYLILGEHKAGAKSARSRLGHVLDYLADRPATRCADVDARWVDGFRAWLRAKPVVSPRGAVTRDRTLGAVEGCVLQLAAAINATPGQKAAFRAEQPAAVAASPVYRADVPMLARMFDFCLRPEAPTEKARAARRRERANLLRYLRFAVSTWARPDAIFDARPVQWHAAARVLDLNPPGRRQTKKHRPKIPIARQFAPYLDSGDAFLPVSLVRAPWERMRAHLGLPTGRESGEKLIRRSMATIARRRIGEAQWRQGEMMLGHVKTSVSDIYALPDPANLGLALAATESIIDDIERLAPGAFDPPAYRAFTAPRSLAGPKKL